ncbi:hypothetical protein SAMN04489761_3407 [Tenacibaculum sp. MAR_2009_124]|uniref:hypothetical protein n=1 Tax=Tenacibaculum sp. MAR_2009_124 TaxID=1250059 RepID=UPI00089B6562|nr:hypothetical protein [Tenacibaculum sp. MAR_2009_124]SEC65361.1 hypothetical protein SAMN04489761_3407 [Tenacibaculum sp. MAR_2009_124]
MDKFNSLDIYITCAVGLSLLYYYFIWKVVRKKNKKNVENMQINDKFVNNSSTKESLKEESTSFDKLFQEMEDDVSNSELLNAFKVDEQENNNSKSQPSNENFKIIRNEPKAPKEDNLDT